MKRTSYGLVPAATAAVGPAAPALADSGAGHGGGMMWGMGAMGVFWILILIVLVLGVFALVKYLQ